jgi:TRAP-type C4-dicarboxylate transport system permease small subunit
MRIAWESLNRIASLLAWAGGAMILGASLIVLCEVISRKLFAAPFSGSDELAAYLFAIGTSWSFAFVLLHRAHVRIDVLYSIFSARSRALLDLLALACLGVFVAALVDRSWELVADNYATWSRSNTPLRLPYVYPQVLWFVGLVVFATTVVAAFVRATSLLIRGNFAGVNASIGVPAQGEEVKTELEGLGITTGLKNHV